MLNIYKCNGEMINVNNLNDKKSPNREKWTTIGEISRYIQTTINYLKSDKRYPAYDLSAKVDILEHILTQINK